MGADYVATVERFFVVLRRRGLMLSSADVALVERWERSGIPVERVCHALAAGAEQHRESRGREAPLPSTLVWYQSFVDDEITRLRAEPPTSAGPREGSGKPAARVEVREALADLAWIGRREADPRRRAAYRAAWRALRSAGDGPETALAVADRVAADAFLAALEEPLRKKILLEVERKLAPELPKLGQRGAAVRRRAIMEDLLVAEYALVRLSR